MFYDVGVDIYVQDPLGHLPSEGEFGPGFICTQHL